MPLGNSDVHQKRQNLSLIHICISNIIDLSNKEGIRIEIDIKRDAVGEVVLNHLYALTQMQVTFGINMVALDHGQPRLFNLKQIIEAFVMHRREEMCIRDRLTPTILRLLGVL